MLMTTPKSQKKSQHSRSTVKGEQMQHHQGRFSLLLLCYHGPINRKSSADQLHQQQPAAGLGPPGSARRRPRPPRSRRRATTPSLLPYGHRAGEARRIPASPADSDPTGGRERRRRVRRGGSHVVRALARQGGSQSASAAKGAEAAWPGGGATWALVRRGLAH